MVDKIWWDWQEKSIQSKYSYGGGSVAAINNFTTFTQFRTGLPPYLSVSVPSSDLKRSCVINFVRLSLVRQRDPRFRFVERYDLGHHGHDGRLVVLHIRLDIIGHFRIIAQTFFFLFIFFSIQLARKAARLL